VRERERERGRREGLQIRRQALGWARAHTHERRPARSLGLCVCVPVWCRGYAEKKITENIDAEIAQVCLDEVSRNTTKTRRDETNEPAERARPYHAIQCIAALIARLARFTPPSIHPSIRATAAGVRAGGRANRIVRPSSGAARCRAADWTSSHCDGMHRRRRPLCTASVISLAGG